MKIHSYSKAVSGIYFQEAFMAFLEQHLSYIKAQGLVTITIADTNAYKHEGNFYGVLDENNVPAIYHYICLRVNNLLNSNQYNGEDTIIYLPNFEVVEQLKNQYVTLGA